MLDCIHPPEKRKYFKPWIFICEKCGAGINVSVKQKGLLDYQ